MTPESFRKMAVTFPEASESEHMGHPDFRVCGKIFATLDHPTVGWAMVKLSPEQQHDFVKLEPAAFFPVKGSWGQRGCTSVLLKAAKKAAVLKALAAAWRNAAPKHLIT